MERFVRLVNGFQPLTIITKRSILDVAAVLGPPLRSMGVTWFEIDVTSGDAIEETEETVQFCLSFFSIYIVFKAFD